MKDIKNAERITLSRGNIKAELMDYGANLLGLFVPDKNNWPLDICLGYENIEDYLVNDPGFGCSILPVCNRIENASFTLDGVKYELDKNDGENNLHSGFKPLHHRFFDIKEKTESLVTFSIEKKDMECNMPGNIKIDVTYELLPSALKITYRAISDKTALFSPTNHSYFNLLGQDKGDVCLDMDICVNADSYTFSNEFSIPTGEIRSVSNTPMDLRDKKPLRPNIDSDFDSIRYAKGYDINYIINKDKETSMFDTEKPLYFAASMESEKSGIKMEVYTDMPGIHLYSGNYLSDGEILKGNAPCKRRGGIAFETQFFPNAINIPAFTSPIINAGEEFVSSTVYKFNS